MPRESRWVERGHALGRRMRLLGLLTALGVAAAASGSAEEAPAGRRFDCRVIDAATGDPVAGASVRIRLSVEPDPPSRQKKRLAETRQTTDDQGKFRLEITPEQAAEPGLGIAVLADHPDFVTRYGFNLYRSSFESERLADRPFFETFALHRGTPVEGRLVTPEGKPAAGIRVWAYCQKPDPKRPRLHKISVQTETTSSPDGRFRFNLLPTGPALLGILPAHHAMSERVLKAGQRGDLGTITLETGHSLRGKVLDAKGRPMGSLYVRARRMREDAHPESLGLTYIPRMIARTALSDENGSFVIPGLPTGRYDIGPEESGWAASLPWDVDRPPSRPLPAVFLDDRVRLMDDEAPAPLTIRAIPHVVVAAQAYNSQGAKLNAHEIDFISLFGNVDGSPWSTSAQPTTEGAFRILAPRGLRDASMSFTAGVDRVIRHRLNRNEPLGDEDRMRLGNLEHDLLGIELVRALSPVLFLKVNAKDGTKPPGIVVWARFTGKRANEWRMIVPGFARSVCWFQEQDDGRFRSTGMIPDEEIAVAAWAKGFAPRWMRLKLPEATVKEATLVLEPEPEAGKQAP